MLQSLIFKNKYCDEYAVVSFAVPVDVLEFSAVSQIITHAEKPQRLLVVRRRESLSSFGAASLQHQASVFGRHSRAEAVGFCAAAVVRLKSAFRHSDEFSSKTKTARLICRWTYVKKPKAHSGCYSYAIDAAGEVRDDALISCLTPGCFIRLLLLIEAKVRVSLRTP
jgi:hypothetical protein